MKKKLLFINGHLNTGGVEKALLDVLRHIDYERYEVDLLLLEELGDYAPQIPSQVRVILRSLQGTYGSLPKCLLRCVAQRDWFSLRMRLILLRTKFFGQRHIAAAEQLLLGGKTYDCVIGFRPGICTQIAAFACEAQRRITWWHHGEINVEPSGYLETALACHKVVAVSESCRQMLARAFPEAENRMTVIPNMLDVEAISQKAEQGESYTAEKMVHIVSVGRLAEEKHFENAIWAAKKLKEEGISVQWHLVGDGVLREALRQKVKDAGVGDCFTLEGNQPNPYPYLKNADLFVHPSYVESFGIVVAEAMALGLPCVVTKSLGPCEFIEDGVNGLLTEQSAQSLAEKVLEILQKRKLYEKIKANTACPERFLPENVMGKIDELLEERAA